MSDQSDNPAPDRTTGQSQADIERIASRLPRIGKYEIVAELGTGAFGRVYKGHDAELDRFVAIKVPLADDVPAELRELFLLEARAAAKVKHQFVCEIYEVGQDGTRPFIVMPFIDGGSLERWMTENPLRPMPEVLELMRDIALGLDAVHRKGLIHRDMKPANVLLHFDDDIRRVLVTDFGLAKLMDGTQTVLLKGTPLYMSPEQWNPVAGYKVGPPSDVYSLGVMLFRLLTGGFPFGLPEGGPLEYGMKVWMEEPRKPSAMRPDLDPRLDELCLKALAKKPSDRYASAKEFANALADYLRKPTLPLPTFPLAVPQLPIPVPPEPTPVESQVQKSFGWGCSLSNPPLAPTEGELRAQAESDYQQGEMYYSGDGVPQDYTKAHRWYQDAAAQGHAQAQCSLGFLYYNGFGVEQDYAKAREWYELAAAQEHAEAQCGLGFLYREGQGVQQDYTQARWWYTKAAAQGYAEAQCGLGFLYFNGLGVEQDYEVAYEWYEMAATQGHAEAQYSLGLFYERGYGVEQDSVKAREWYEKAAAQGDATAQHRLQSIPEEDHEATTRKSNTRKPRPIQNSSSVVDGLWAIFYATIGFFTGFVRGGWFTLKWLLGHWWILLAGGYFGGRISKWIFGETVVVVICGVLIGLFLALVFVVVTTPSYEWREIKSKFRGRQM